MKVEEFNQKWDEAAYESAKENPTKMREYLADCSEMYETEGFCDTFKSPYDGMKQHNGKSFEVVRRCTEKDMDIEWLPAWVIKFQDGVQINAVPEEICKIERIWKQSE